MFLFSGRGYWQELIESIVWAHNKLKVALSPTTIRRSLFPRRRNQHGAEEG
jgi:photosystem I P700 chlorophyll a apoprotein A1